MDILTDQGIIELLEHLQTATCACWVTLRVLDSQGEQLVLTASVGADWSKTQDIRADSDDPVAIAFLSGESSLIDGVGLYPTDAESGDDAAIKSSIHIPLRHRNMILGVLSIASEDTDAFKPETSSILTAYA